MAGRRLLILGGTAEAVELADSLSAVKGVEIVFSLAGITRNPRRPKGEVRTGGFGGAVGLAKYLKAERIATVFDATHPHAAQISQNANEAGRLTNIPILHLVRAPWRAEPNDCWHEVATVADAATWLTVSNIVDDATIFLTIGRKGVSAFGAVPRFCYLVRSVEPPNLDVLPKARTILARGPFSVRDEISLFRNHSVACLVTKNSGGTSGFSKIAAALELGIPIVMISRPPPPDGVTVETVKAALDWLDRL